MISMRALECLVTIVERASLTKAAAVLHMSQPALSHQIAAIERELGTPVIERLPRGIRPTAAGTGGRIRIACAETMTAWVPVLRAWRRRFPDVELDLREYTSADRTRGGAEGDPRPAVLHQAADRRRAARRCRDGWDRWCRRAAAGAAAHRQMVRRGESATWLAESRSRLLDRCSGEALGPREVSGPLGSAPAHSGRLMLRGPDGSVTRTPGIRSGSGTGRRSPSPHHQDRPASRPRAGRPRKRAHGPGTSVRLSCPP